MLATHCPICNSALLQKELKVQCASCNMPVMTEEQYSTRAEGSAKLSVTNDSDVPSAVPKAIVPSSVPSAIVPSASVLSEPSATMKIPPTPAPLASLSESIAKTRKLKELEESYLSVDNFDGYYSDNDKIGASNTLEEEKREYDLNNKKRDLVSVKLGEKMLSGWTLLAAVCPFPACYGTPLMSVKGNKQLQQIQLFLYLFGVFDYFFLK
jgi:uncharacterized Zn finger protein (UPF0148 family)